MAVNAVSNHIHSSGILSTYWKHYKYASQITMESPSTAFSRFPLCSDGTTWKSSSLVPRPPPFLPFVCVHNNTWERKTGVLIFVDLPILCIIVNANGRSKQGRPGTEAKNALYAIYQVVPAVLSPWSHQSQCNGHTSAGWSPSGFISSREKKADYGQQKPEDFMDEEVCEYLHSVLYGVGIS